MESQDSSETIQGIVESAKAHPTAPEPTVYIIDPDDTVRDRLENLFRLRKLPVRSFASAEGFLASYDGTQSGCLILEFDLPGLASVDLLETLAGRKVDLPAIVLSARGSVSSAVRALRAGAADFVEKPFVPHILVRQVREIVRKATRPAMATRDPESPS
jgi:two-component system response regulator DctR